MSTNEDEAVGLFFLEGNMVQFLGLLKLRKILCTDLCGKWTIFQYGVMGSYFTFYFLLSFHLPCKPAVKYINVPKYMYIWVQICVVGNKLTSRNWE